MPREIPPKSAKIPLCAVILCGGKSSRMGESKPLLPFGDSALVAYQFAKLSKIFQSVFISLKSTQAPAIIKALDSARFSQDSAVDFTKDSTIPRQDSALLATDFARDSSDSSEIPAFSRSQLIIENSEIYAPIIGIAQSFRHTGQERLFILACDNPFIETHTFYALCEKSWDYDVVYAADSARAHPLVGVWRKSSLSTIESAVEKRNFKIRELFHALRTHAICFEGEQFCNLNSPSDYKQSLERLNAGK